MTNPRATWTASIEWAPQRQEWLVEMERDGDRVFMHDADGRSFVAAKWRQKKAEERARRDLAFAVEHDRLPYRAEQFTCSYQNPWRWRPADWTEPPVIQVQL